MSAPIKEIQHSLKDQKLDGWLFFDHHQRDPLAYRILQVTPPGIVSRRWYYYIPAEGEPRGLVHRIESHHLNSLPGEIQAYSSWSEQKDGISRLLRGAHHVAMQWSPDCAIPYVSLVDGGTIDLLRTFGIEITSSADLVQYFEARWTQQQLDSHLAAGRLVDAARAAAFTLIGDRLRSGERVTEWEVTQFILQQFAASDLFTDHGPNCSVNENAANPHYEPTEGATATIKAGDVVLIDLWAKLNQPGAVYYDITWMGYCGGQTPAEVQNVFTVVRDARDKAVQRVISASASGEMLQGYQVDDVARAHIRDCGFGEYFVHRTGHSIGEDVHGTGANMDNLETHDTRQLIPWTCFSVEPGVYLKNFGVRCEVNVFVGEGSARVTGEVQDKLVLIG
jgi:Xaa-Pro dipeptidase